MLRAKLLRYPTVLPLLLLLVAFGCRKGSEVEVTDDAAGPNYEAETNEAAQRYVELILGIGVHDDGYVDAYYGDPAVQEAVTAAAKPLADLKSEAEDLIAVLAGLDLETSGPEWEQRRRFLKRQSEAALARIQMLEGESFSFDEESELLYDAVAPHLDADTFDTLLADLEAELPGEGTVTERYNVFRDQFIIPPDKLDAVFRVAIEECKQRTAAHFALPDTESFTLEYVTDKSWSGYNWYQGKYESLIQINTDLPIYIDRAVDLACHEGYPGHHVFNLLLEKNLVVDRGWVENSVYPLYSPQSLIAEGTANYGIHIAFPGEERVAFERDHLFALAGLDPAQADSYYRILSLAKELSYAGNLAARLYLDGEIEAEAAADLLERYALASPERAAQRIRFIENYRAYVINYNLGQDLVRTHVEVESGGDPEEAWRVFEELLSTQVLPSSLTQEGVH